MIFTVRNGQHEKIIENPRTTRHLKKNLSTIKKIHSFISPINHGGR